MKNIVNKATNFIKKVNGKAVQAVIFYALILEIAYLIYTFSFILSIIFVTLSALIIVSSVLSRDDKG